MKEEKKSFLSGLSILVGTCIGAGVLGLPYIAAKSGFFVVLLYILFVGGLIYLVNSFLGEVVLRTKGNHQLGGYARKYLGKKYGWIMSFGLIFGIYSAIVAFLVGISESLSYLFFSNGNYVLFLGIIFGLGMSFLIFKGLNEFKKFEKWGVLIIFILLALIIGLFFPKIDFLNLLTFNFSHILLPFGVVLFAFMSFSAIPQIKIVLKGKEKLFRKVLWVGTIASILFYLIFTFVVLGYVGLETPEIATFSLGKIFIVLGIFTMFTSYLAGGNALRDSFYFDNKYGKVKSWFLATIVPLILFIILQFFDFFSFTKILSIGGIVSGGIVAIVSLLMVRKAKLMGNRKPEYEVRANLWIIVLLIFIFLFGIVLELL